MYFTTEIHFQVHVVKEEGATKTCVCSLYTGSIPVEILRVYSLSATLFDQFKG